MAMPYASGGCVYFFLNVHICITAAGFLKAPDLVILFKILVSAINFSLVYKS